MKKILYIIILFVFFIQTISAQVTFTVTKTTDPDPFTYEYNNVDSLCSPEMYGTLQWAIRKLNDNGGNCIINFNIPGTGEQTITLNYYLPQIQGVNFVIDGTTQAGYLKNNPTVIIDINAQDEVGDAFNIIKSDNAEIKGLYLKNFTYMGIRASYVNNIRINDCTINLTNGNTQNQRGIFFVEVTNSEIYGNIIGTDINGVSNGTLEYGILASNNSQKISIGDTLLNKKNIIVNASNSGIYIIGPAKYIKVSGNNIYNNAIKGIYLTENGNENKQAPVILDIDSTTNILTGTAEPNDIIELFGSTGNQNATVYVKTIQADANGNWSTIVDNIPDYYIATATDVNKNTSEFSNVVKSTLTYNDICFIAGGDTIYMDDYYIIINGDTTYTNVFVDDLTGDTTFLWTDMIYPDTINVCNTDSIKICWFHNPLSSDSITFNGCYNDTVIYNHISNSHSFSFLPFSNAQGIYEITLFNVNSGSFSLQNYGAKIKFYINIFSTPDPTIYSSPSPPIICQGETIDLAVQQVPPPTNTTYYWSNGVTTHNNDNLSPQTNTWYYVTVSNDGCAASDSIHVIVKPSPVIDSIISTETCINPGCNGTATVYASGGAPFNYQWDNNAGNQTVQTAINLCQGTYTVTVTNDYSCSVTGQVNIDTLERYSLQIITQNTSCLFACDGQATIGILAQGGLNPPYQFELSNGNTINGLLANFTGLCNGNYSITVTDANGCEEYDNFTIGHNLGTTPSPSFVVDTSNCLVTNDSILFTITNYDTANTYIWNFDGTQQTSTSQTISHIYTEHGYHCVSVTANGPCGTSIIPASSVIYISKNICCDSSTVFDFPNGYTVSGNITWNNVNYNVNGDIIINAGASLTIDNSTIRFSEKSRIIVKPKGYLDIDNSRLATINPDFCMWQGIEVWGNTFQNADINNQGYVKIDSSQIENAYVAIMVGARNLNAICPNGLHNKYYTYLSGGLVHISNTKFFENGKSIVFVERQNPSRNASNCYIYENNFIARTIVPDEYYNINNTTHYPSTLNLWAGNANDLQRGDIGIETNEVENLTIRSNNFKNIEYGIKSSDANLLIVNNNFENLTQGIFILNTYTSVNNNNKIQGNSFNLIPNYRVNNDQGHMIHLENCSDDIITNNTFGDLININSQDKNGVGIYCKNSSGFRIGNYNQFLSVTYGAIVRNSGSAGGWIGPENGEFPSNKFKNVKSAILTQFNNQQLTIRCNKFIPNNNLTYYSGTNINTTGTLADQGTSPVPFPLNLKTRAPAGNKFINHNHKEINCSGFCPAGYDYWHHINADFTPVALSANIHLHNANVYFNPNESCLDLINPNPSVIPNFKSVSDSLKYVILQAETERNNLIANLDKGNTQYLLDLINSNTNSVNLLIELYNNSLLSDTVLISLLVNKPHMPIPFLTLILADNTPVSKKVEPYFYNKVNNMHGYFKNVLLQLQGNNLFTQTVRDYNRYINSLELWRNNVINKAIVYYLDSANYNKDSVLWYIANENNNIAYKQILFNTYLQDSLLNNAYSVFNNIQAQTNEQVEWKNLNTVLLSLKDSGKTVFDLDSVNIEYIRTLAYNCNGGLATSQARAIWYKLTGITVVCGADAGYSERALQVTPDDNNNYDNDIVETGNLILKNNYPDPCNVQTNIPYVLPDGFIGDIRVYNIKGELLSTNLLENGDNELILNTRNLKSGIYIYKMFINNIPVGKGKFVVSH